MKYLQLKTIAAGFLLEVAVAEESVPLNKPSLVDEGKLCWNPTSQGPPLSHVGQGLNQIFLRLAKRSDSRKNLAIKSKVLCGG